MPQKKKKTHLSDGHGGTLCHAQPVPDDRVLDYFGEYRHGTTKSFVSARRMCRGCYRIARETGRPLLVDAADLRAARRAERRRPRVLEIHKEN